MKRNLRIPLPGRKTLLLLLFIALSSWFVETRAQTVTEANLSLSANNSSLLIGETVSVNVNLDNPGLTIIGVDAVVEYDHELLEIISITGGDSDLKTLAPGSNGQVDLSRAQTSESVIEVSALAYDWETDATTEGENQNVEPLIILNFRAKAAGEANIRLVYNGPGETTDSNIVVGSEDVMASPSSGIILNIASNCVINYDFDEDGNFTILDIMQVAGRWNSHLGDGRYNALMDVDNDSDIDIIDVQRVAANWGQSCTL